MAAAETDTTSATQAAAADSADVQSGQAGYGSGLVGGILDAVIGPIMANQQKGWASKASRHARKWSEYMSSTAYQRAVKDLEAAGLNPMLAYVQGGASSPVGVAAHTPNIQSSDLSRAAERAVSTGRQSGLFKAQLAHINETVRKTKAEADTAQLGTFKVMSDMDLQQKHGVLLEAEAERNRRQGLLLDAERSWTNTRDRATRLGIPYSAEQEEWVRGTPFGQGSRAIKSIGRRVRSFLNTPMDIKGARDRGVREAQRMWDSWFNRDQSNTED